jgi:hypothetical protein
MAYAVPSLERCLLWGGTNLILYDKDANIPALELMFLRELPVLAHFQTAFSSGQTIHFGALSFAAALLWRH